MSGYLSTEQVEQLLKRATDRVVVDEAGCWLWPGATNRGGYGVIKPGGRMTRTELVHRFVYRLSVGPIPADLQLDHLCRVKTCCNPTHLEPVTAAENTRRSTAGWNLKAMAQERTHCKHGHEFTPENTWIYDQGGYPTRKCRTCSRARWHRWNEKRKAASA